jgi:hypothetical protein
MGQRDARHPLGKLLITGTRIVEHQATKRIELTGESQLSIEASVSSGTEIILLARSLIV